MPDYLEEVFSANIENAIFEHDKQPHIALAVSGGSDSVALLIAANAWAKANGTSVTVLTVDHKLREGSMIDCQFVQSLCSMLGLSCFLLKWDKLTKPTAAIQAKARQARYNMMTNLCRDLDILYLCTAHHKDDSVENFFLRLSKGSGALSLFIQPLWFWNNVMVIRPLIQASKEECRRYLRSKGIAWREDPSNLNCIFTRNALRLWLKETSKQSSCKALFDSNRIFEAQKRISDLAPLMQDQLARLMTKGVFISPLAFARISLAALQGANPEIAKMALSHVLTTVRGLAKVPSYKLVAQIYSSSLSGSCKATLHGCKAVISGKHLFIYRFFGKHPPKDQKLGSGLLWDGRFLCSAGFASCDYVVSSLAYSSIKPLNSASCCPEILKLDVANSMREEIIASLPVVKLERTGEMLSCPHLGWRSSFCDLEGVAVEFAPCFFSSVVHLYCSSL